MKSIIPPSLNLPKFGRSGMPRFGNTLLRRPNKSWLSKINPPGHSLLASCCAGDLCLSYNDNPGGFRTVQNVESGFNPYTLFSGLWINDMGSTPGQDGCDESCRYNVQLQLVMGWGIKAPGNYLNTPWWDSSGWHFPDGSPSSGDSFDTQFVDVCFSYDCDAQALKGCGTYFNNGEMQLRWTFSPSSGCWTIGVQNHCYASGHNDVDTAWEIIICLCGECPPPEE